MSERGYLTTSWGWLILPPSVLLVLCCCLPHPASKQSKYAHFPLSHWQQGLFHLAPLKEYKRLILQGMDEMQISILFM